MEETVGILKVRVVKGTNLAVRDLRSSDPYVIVRFGDQKVKTRVIKQNLNPVWNEELSLYIPQSTPVFLKLEVYDRDIMRRDDKMGNGQVCLQDLATAVMMQKIQHTNRDISCASDNKSRQPLAKEIMRKSVISCVDGNMVQKVCVKLENVECGELELQIKWVDLTD